MDTLWYVGGPDFADDLALLSHTHRHMQEKTRRLSKFGQQVGLQISKRKTEVMTLNVNAPAPVLLDDQALPSKKKLYLSGQHRQTEWRHQGGYSEQTEQSQERLQESERSLEIITVQHQD